ncbi:hypothetical protein A2996_01560 [Candidatus Campbellbacteria bacterium RIFCSPLOWO2_01_FULL_34_15]|uniref:Uncharacterized protein n=1 Tax=Candidatus Campbellbacteria bacterium RIFCSPLOWO2_01_FULL_34_15 TaxID=1797579 RepID=A0A1F5EM27_9BACT|nr:MAG: hypothetical protein A2996_01560 [Candidatus Campbellbacteria bacterium RIFCSPLOWO2_01_FULL_34_15]
MKKIVSFCLFVLMFFSSVFVTNAEELPVEIPDFVLDQMIESGIDVSSGQFVVLADISLYDGKILRQDKNDFGLSFNIVNHGDVQPQIKYVVELVDKNGFPVHKQYYEDVFSLNTGEDIVKEIKYTAPSNLKGEFEIIVSSGNEKGLDYGFVSFGIVNIDGDGGLLINPFSCKLKIGEELFAVNQGIDIDRSTESPVMECDIVNSSQNKISFIPVINIRERSSFGQSVEEKKFPEVELLAGETKTLEFDVPLPEKPQAYDGDLILQNKLGNNLSNMIPLHFVIRGESATVQNVSLDKDSYKEDEKINITFVLSGSAQNFLDARVRDQQQQELFAFVSITTGVFDRLCGEKEIKADSGVLNMEIVSLRDCKNPVIKAQVKNAEGNVLDENIFYVETKEDKSFGWAIYVLIGVIVLAGIAIYLKKIGVKFFMTVFLLGFGIFFGGNSVEATTVSWNPGGSFLTDTVTIVYDMTGYRSYDSADSRYVYYSIDDVKASMKLTWNVCNNSISYMQGAVKIDTNNWQYIIINTQNPNAAVSIHLWVLRSTAYTTKNFGPRTVGNHTVTYSGLFARYYGDSYDFQTLASGSYVCLACTHTTSFVAIPNDFAKQVAASNGTLCPCYQMAATNSSLVKYLKVLQTTNATCGNRSDNYSAAAPPYPATTTAWPASTAYCSLGTNSTSPAFPGLGVSVPWTCVGINGGTNASCSASRFPLNGDCGIRDLQRKGSYTLEETTWPTGSVWCKAGTNSASPAFPVYGQTVYWNCNGSGTGATNASCSASRAVLPEGSGECGTKDGIYAYTETSYPVGSTWCDNGTEETFSPSEKFPDQGEMVTWKCNFYESIANCSAYRDDPPTVGCGSRDTYRAGTYLSTETTWPVGSNWCQFGTASGTPTDFPEWNSSASWSCVNGVDSITCTANRQGPGGCMPGTCDVDCGTLAREFSYETLSWPAGNWCLIETTAFNPDPNPVSFPDRGGISNWLCEMGLGSASCSATRSNIPTGDGDCGVNERDYLLEETNWQDPSNGWCLGGIKNLTPAFPTAGNSATWNCQGTLSTDTCTAEHLTEGCGDGICSAGEEGNCFVDCCGNGSCDANENFLSCPSDCDSKVIEF